MLAYLNRFFDFMRPAFSRKAAFNWFVIVVIAMVLKTDNYGVSSIIRALNLDFKLYECLLHFFHSTAFSINSLMNYWASWVSNSNLSTIINNRKILIGDHTYSPKEGKRMPAVVAIHQTSETSSKPSFFRGHFWGCLSLVINTSDKILSIPLIMRIMQGINKSDSDIKSKTSCKINSLTSIILLAIDFAMNTKNKCYLILDGFFATGTSFSTAAKDFYLQTSEQLVHLIVNAKKNAVAYTLPIPDNKIRRGRKRKYGKKLKLFELFETMKDMFIPVNGIIYGKEESFSILCLNLIWKPLKYEVRFVLANTSYGKIILMTSDFTLDPVKIVELYSYRVSIESMFNVFKNIICGFAYHFWSKYLSVNKRIPSKNNNAYPDKSSNPAKSKSTCDAIEKFVNINVIVLGLLQLISIKFKNLIWSKSNCWLRTFSSNTPSEFITKISFSQIMKNHFRIIVKNPIIDLILDKQSKFNYYNHLDDVA